MTPAEYTERVEQLAREMRVKLVWIEEERAARAGPAGRAYGYLEPWAEVPRITDQTTALTALHELGHHAMGHVDMRAGLAREVRLDSEAEAWSWAFEHIGEPLTDEARDRAYRMLGTYLAGWTDGYYGKPGRTFHALYSSLTFGISETSALAAS